MKNTYFLLFIILICSCNKPYKAPPTPVLKTDIIGDWKVAFFHADLDSLIISKFPSIEIGEEISFYGNGRFKKHDDYYTEKDVTHKVPGFVSDYKVKGDSIFIYDLVSKHWAAIKVTMQTKDRIEIDNRQNALDYHYYFNRVPNN